MKNILVALIMLGSYGEALACYNKASAGEEPLVHCLKLADQNDPRAQYQLGNMYENGNGVQANIQTAETWYLKSADLGYAEAQFALGNLYEKIPVAPQSNTPTFNSSPDLSGLGDLAAQANLDTNFDLCLQIGDGPIEPIKWYRLAAAQGHTDAQLKLGEIYQQGRGVPPDDMLAYMWFEIATRQGRKATEEMKLATASRLSPELQQEAENLAEEWLLENRNQAE